MVDGKRDPHPSHTSPWYAATALVVVLCCFCGPLFIGLDEWDLQSDEAIYSHAIDRMLETGDWLTPRSIRFDEPFLEKPPLKLWLAAAAIHAGLLPQDEYGFRFLDALFGAAAFVYVFWLGRWLAGSICGIVAVLVLFTLDALLFDHGLRSNNMDAALVLAYCGGVFHFARWVENSGRKRNSCHATAAVLYFVLGFMTKYVAVLFLPLVCAFSVCWHSHARVRTRSDWRDWTVPTLLAVALIMPWFVYQLAHAGGGLWETMWRDQVVARFAGVTDPRRLLPWHYYFSWAAEETISAGSQWISLLGFLVLGAMAWQGRPWLARVLLLWLVVPFGLLSLGAGKFLHYMYPFLPPLALGAGAAAAMLVAAIERMIDRAAAATGKRLRIPPLTSITSISWAQRLLVGAGLLVVALGIWTAMEGRARLEIGGLELRNSSVLRPLAIATILFAVSGRAWIVSHALAIATVAMILPVGAYTLTVNRFSEVDHPLRAVRDCALMMQASRPETRVFLHYYQLLNHSPYYYLSRIGPWDEQGTGLTNAELDRRLSAPGQQTFTILSRSDYEERLVRGPVERRLPPGLALQVDIVLLTPGPFEQCGRVAVAAGGEGIGALAPPAGSRRP